MRTAGVGWWLVVAVMIAGCSPGAPAEQSPPSSPTTRASSEPSVPAMVPPRSGPARVELWHCGVRLLGYPDGMWEVRHPPFDATNAPDSFTGHGRASVPRTDRLVYVDDGGQRLRFVPGREVPPVLCD